MKSLPQVNLSFQPLTHLLQGAIRAKLLLAAIELRVFSHLTEPMSADSLARKLQTHPPNTRLFLDALVANGLLRKRDQQYSDTALARWFLVEGKPTYLGKVLADDAEWMQPALENLTALVKHGPPPSGRPPHSIPWPKEAEIRANSQRAGFAQRVAAMISQLTEFPRMNRMLDLGAGAGLVGLAIVAAHPTMTGVLFDRPEVVEVAKRFVREYCLQDRVTTMAGDFLTDSIGAGYDLVWTSFAIRRAHLDPMLRKIHAALNPGGLCISLAEGLTRRRTRPTTTINSMLPMLLHSNECPFEEGEIAQAMLRAGFRSVHTRRMPTPHLHAPLVVDIARK